jgi:hypothetical protein
MGYNFFFTVGSSRGRPAFDACGSFLVGDWTARLARPTLDAVEGVAGNKPHFDRPIERPHDDLENLRLGPVALPETTIRKALGIFCPVDRTVWSPGMKTGGYRPLFGDLYDTATISKVKIPELRRGQGAPLFLKALRELLAEGHPVSLARIDKGQATLVRKPGGSSSWGRRRARRRRRETALVKGHEPVSLAAYEGVDCWSAPV